METASQWWHVVPAPLPVTPRLIRGSGGDSPITALFHDLPAGPDGATDLQCPGHSLSGLPGDSEYLGVWIKHTSLLEPNLPLDRMLVGG